MNDLRYREFVPFAGKKTQKCPNNFLIRPTLTVRLAAEMYIESVPQLRDNPYIALHLRRGDFVELCRNGESCLHSIQQIAKATLKKMEATEIRYLFLATGGFSKEVLFGLFKLDG